MENTINSEQSLRNLKELSKTFTPKDVKFLVALDSDSSLKDCFVDANIMVDCLKKFVDNNHSLEGLDEATRSRFGEIEIYTKQ